MYFRAISYPLSTKNNAALLRMLFLFQLKLAQVLPSTALPLCHSFSYFACTALTTKCTLNLITPQITTTRNPPLKHPLLKYPLLEHPPLEYTPFDFPPLECLPRISCSQNPPLGYTPTCSFWLEKITKKLNFKRTTELLHFSALQHFAFE